MLVKKSIICLFAFFAVVSMLGIFAALFAYVFTLQIECILIAAGCMFPLYLFGLGYTIFSDLFNIDLFDLWMKN